jgi:SAM-dependent methyltransferase
VQLSDQVKAFWEQEPCGAGRVKDLAEFTPEWFKRLEAQRYALEPFIHAAAQFTRHHGKTLLEIGVGAGSDHLQWARAGLRCHGVDLTEAAIEATKAHLAVYGFASNLQRANAENLPFADESFDLVYSWGVIHHAAHPEAIVREIRRVLKPGGEFIGMFYKRRSLVAFKLWLRYALGRGRPWRSYADLIWNHMESPGTKAYTICELKQMFGNFTHFSARPVLTPYDTARFPAGINQFFPDQWGWFIVINACK